MSMPHPSNHSCPSEARRHFPLQPLLYDRSVRQADAHINGATQEDGLHQTAFAYGKPVKANSPISSLSPPHSLSSDTPSSSDYHCESEHSSCSQLTTDSYIYNQLAYPQSLQGHAPNYDQFTGAIHHAVLCSKRFKSNKITLLELESTLMGPDGEDASLHDLAGEASASWAELLQNPATCISNAPSIQPRNQETYPASAPMEISNLSYFPEVVNPVSRTKHMLVMCASAIADGKVAFAEAVMKELRKEVSVRGEPIERLAAYMSEGLVAKLQASGSTIYRSLRCMEAPAVDVLSAMQKLYEICPYFKFAYMAANGAIAEAFKDEAKVHIFDCQIAQGTQWVSLIQALAKRPGGAPSVRITTVDDPSTQSSPIGGMQAVKGRLCKIADSLGVPFEFHVVPVKLCELQPHMIERSAKEALAVNFTLQLHHMPDESVSLKNPRDRLIRVAKSLEPKVLTLVEQEANTNTAPFLARFLEALDYYSAVFESIDAALPRESKDRVNVEEQCLARDIVNVIACEGLERVERHELAAKWRARMAMAGFRAHPLSSPVNSTIKALLNAYSENYRLEEEGGALFLGWMNRSLVVASAWKVC